MDLGLKDKVALVVASSTGLGFATALELARDGAKVVLSGRTQSSLDKAVAQIKEEVGGGTAVAAFTTDVTKPAQNEKLITDTAAHFGGLDILITNAGGPAGGTFDTLDLAAWDQAYNLTLMSAVRLIKFGLPHLRKSEAASVLTITSISTKQPIAGLLLSNVMRPAVAGMTKTLSLELAPENIRVNSILPGWTATERVNHIFEYRAEQNGTDLLTEKGKVTATIPMGRMAEPAEFGRVAAFLSSPAASYITGGMILVDGGSYAGLL